MAAVMLMAGAPHASAQSPEGFQPGDWKLTYRVYVGGLHVLDATGHLGLDRDAYRIGLQAATDGFLGRLASWKTDILTTGTIAADGTARPSIYRTVGAWRDEPRNTTLDYDPDGIPRLTIAEPPPEEDREPVPDELKPGTVDPMTAMLTAVQAVAAGRGCDAMAKVYDGRQRYDLTFIAKGTESLTATDMSVFAGEAQICGFEYEQLAGAWKGENRRSRRDEEERRRRDDRDGKDILMWIASAAPGAPPVPVRAQGSSPLGTVMVHLADMERVKPEADGQAAAPPAR